MEQPKDKSELNLELADARVDYAEALRKIVVVKRELAYLAFKKVNGDRGDGTLDGAGVSDEHSYGEHELNLAEENENIVRGDE